jgi:hypothetical protein
MRTRADQFVTENSVIPLTGVETNFTEENPRFKDSIWTKYTLPFKYYYKRNFLSENGQYSSLNNSNLKQKHEGYHIFEGKVRKGVLEFLEIRKKWASIQIDSGFEELPNFEKKLRELPVEFKLVNDIYNHANEIVTKKYPETNYNFPKLYTTAYDTDQDGWKNFNCFINDRILTTGTSIKEFPRNEIQENTNGWDVVNRNIIQPIPYLLHVLKVGFLDAGFVLQGDILDDPQLKQKGIFSPEQYYTTGEQKYQKTYVFSAEFFDNEIVTGNIFGHWVKKFKIDAPGKYRFIGSCFTDGDPNGTLVIKKNGILLMTYGSGTTSQYINFDQVVQIDVDEAETAPEYTFEYFGRVYSDRFNVEGVNIGIAEIKINPMRQNTTSGDPIPFVFNFNRVDLRRALPDMTFGDLVNTIKNWRNYDLSFDGNVATMNRIVVDKFKEPEDFREFEVDDPIRSRNDKRYFNIKFPEVEGLNLDSVFFDETGYQLNKSVLPKDTTEIAVNGFCLPLEVFRAVTTAKAYDESGTLMLVHYEGLDNNGDNHAKSPPGLHGTYFADSVKDWFLNRLTNFTYKWTFRISKSKIRKFNIRSEIFAYNKKHWIKSWVKNSLSRKYYSVEIETETF